VSAGVRTAGIDLATKPENTAVCVVEWSGASAVVSFSGGLEDADLVQVCRTYDNVGVDCPFGWPLPFVEAIRTHADHGPWPGRGEPPGAYAKDSTLRCTDRAVHRRTGLMPLRVAADRIGLTAMRCALLLDALGTVDRTGRTGNVAEVYPAASLKSWGQPCKGLKGPDGTGTRELVLKSLTGDMPLTWQDGARERCVVSDHSFDALVCAITARAVATHRTWLPESDEQAHRARSEGWIHLPKVGPGLLMSPTAWPSPRP
jgi:predicted nuclease with RNAse H fold